MFVSWTVPSTSCRRVGSLGTDSEAEIAVQGIHQGEQMRAIPKEGREGKGIGQRGYLSSNAVLAKVSADFTEGLQLGWPLRTVYSWD